MKKTCQKCGTSLQENDSLCPECGAVYGSPAADTPKRNGVRIAVLGIAALLIVLVCLLVWKPFRPGSPTPSTSQQPSSSTQPTTLPADPNRLSWSMDAQVVRADGSLVSNTTVEINGLIQPQEDEMDILSLDIRFLPTFQYMGEQEEYFALVEPGDIFPYYVSGSYFYDSNRDKPFYIRFAIDPQAGCALFILPNAPDQYLVATTGEATSQEILTHFQTFLNTLPKDN